MIMAECTPIPVALSNQSCEGKYVATRSFNDGTVVAVGESWSAVLAEAREKGIQHPVVIYVPAKDSVGHF